MADRIPRPLLPLLVVALILGVIWSVLTPLFQAPDEASHFSYAQRLAETFDVSPQPAPIYSAEHIRAAIVNNTDHVARQLAVKPEWSEAIYEQWQRDSAGDRRDDGGGLHSAASNPPLGYLWQAAGYRVAGGDFFDRVTGVRIASALWLLVTVLGTWLLAGELLGRNRLLQVVAAAVPALLPMMPFISASAGPDGMLYGLWALALWLGVRVIRRGPEPASGVGFGVVVGAACVTKTTSYALLPALAIAAGVAIWRHRRDRPAARLAVWGLATVAPLVVFLGGWALLARSLDRPAVSQLTGATVDAGATNWRQLASYLWQYYLPRLPGQEPFRFSQTGYPAFQIWIKQGWAAFGWLEVRFSDTVYRVLAILTLIAGAGALAAVARAWRRIDWAVAAYLATAAVALLAGLHWTDYRFIEGGNAFIQGRYLFPILPILAVGLAAAVGLAGERWRPRLAGGVLAFLLAFHAAAIGLVVDRFYA